MMVYHWPGNVRELENCIERAVLSSTDDVIHAYTLPPSLQTAEQTGTQLILPDSNPGQEIMLDNYKSELIAEALKKHHGNVTSVSRELKTTPRIINYSIKKLASTT